MGPAFRRLLPFVLRYQRQFSVGLLFVLFTTAIQLLPPWVMKNAVDDAVYQKKSSKQALDDAAKNIERAMRR